MSRDWRPLGARTLYNRTDLKPGDVVALQHGVWRVVSVRDEPVLDDSDRDAWIADGMPPLEGWRRRPYTVEAVHLGGWSKHKMTPGKPGAITVHPVRVWRFHWEVYPNGRWAQCSCCGEPMPCRAELADRTVVAAEERVVAFERRLPGCCWACEEPITSRQHAVTYPGINLDLPTADGPRFHTRSKCVRAAEAYERRWLEGGPGRHRALTYPECMGTLVVHHDGTSECHGGQDDCWGHDTHDHRALTTACYAQSHGCGRGCTREGHPGCRTRPRKPRESDLLT